MHKLFPLDKMSLENVLPCVIALCDEALSLSYENKLDIELFHIHFQILVFIAKKAFHYKSS